MTRPPCAVVLLAAGLLAGSACSLMRRTPEVRYYVLTVPGSPSATLAAPVRVSAFSTDRPYATARLAFRTSPYRIDYYTYHRWAADPRQAVATAVRDYLEQAASRDGGPPFVIDGHVRRLEEVDEASGPVGAIVLDVRVEQGGQVVLQRSYSETEPAATSSPEAVAAALSRALGRILDQLTAELAARDGH